MIGKLLHRKKKETREPEDWRKTMEESERIMRENPGLFPRQGFIQQVEEFTAWQRREKAKRNTLK